MQRSHFDGGLFSYFGHSLLAGLMILLSGGLLTPWAIVLMHRWKTRHTVIDGYRLEFYGTGIGLFGQWIKWVLLTIITLGIYGFWLHLKLEQWKVKYTTVGEVVYATKIEEELDF